MSDRNQPQGTVKYMTDRQRILSAIRGEMPDRLPFVPRLEFWYRARRRAGTLPPELRGLSLMEITDLLGVAYYANFPDLTDHEGDGMVDCGLGIYHLRVLPYKVTVEGVDRRIFREGPETVVEYHTPVGTIRTTSIFTEEMLAAGASVPWLTQQAIREPRDFEAMGYIFSHIKVEAQVDGLLALREQVGERGIVVSLASGHACPIQHIMKKLMPTQQFFYALQDYPSKIERLAEQMEPFYEGLKSAAAESSAEVVFLGSNYDDSITYPAFFRKHFLVPLREYAEALHRKGKYLMTHTDGENQRLLPIYVEAGFDIADSICPYPMTRCHIEEIREAFADRITIWGGVPSVLLCPGSASFDEFRRFVDGLLERYGHESHFVLGISDMVTADADWDRFQYLAAKVASLEAH